MSAVQAGKAIRGLAYRAAALDATGAPLAGANNLVQKACFVSADWTPDIEAAQEYLTKCASGNLDVHFRGPAVAKGYTVNVELSSLDFQEQALLTGARLLTSGGNTVGMQAPALGIEAVPYGVSFEVWTPFVDGDGNPVDSANPFLHWALPKVKFTEGAKKIENGPMQYLLTGYAFEDVNWASGPNSDWTYDSTRVWQVAKAASLPSPLQDGTQAAAA